MQLQNFSRKNVKETPDTKSNRNFQMKTEPNTLKKISRKREMEHVRTRTNPQELCLTEGSMARTPNADAARVKILAGFDREGASSYLCLIHTAEPSLV